MADYDVIVIGAGNAGLASAISAREHGADSVLVIEKAPEDLRGGNTYFSGGLFRFAFESSNDLARLVPDADQQVPRFFDQVTPYTSNQFWADLLRVTHNRTDPQLATLLIDRSYDTMRWMADLGIYMEVAVSLSGICHRGKIGWSPGAIVRARHEGVGLSKMWFDVATDRGIQVQYDTAALALLQSDQGQVTGVRVQGSKGHAQLTAGAVVLASGGFEANAALRACYLGKPWDQAKVRGTAFNTGDGLRMAFEVFALPHGEFTGCHSTPIDADAPAFGTYDLTDKSNRLSYPYGIMLNRLGSRFLDEGEDFQFYTYAKMGGIILNQPGGIAYQIFDAEAVPLLEQRYKTGKPVVADSLDSLIDQLPVDRALARAALTAYNEATGSGEFDPTKLDGLATQGLRPPKSNWARPLRKPPFYAYPVTGGITFTFGGVKIDERAQVIGSNWKPIPGLFACGEIVGGLFHHNYLGGAGLMSGAVFGRIAGASAAASRDR